jgi:hypothetical protein
MMTEVLEQMTLEASGVEEVREEVTVLHLEIHRAVKALLRVRLQVLGEVLETILCLDNRKAPRGTAVHQVKIVI